MAEAASLINGHFSLNFGQILESEPLLRNLNTVYGLLK